MKGKDSQKCGFWSKDIIIPKDLQIEPNCCFLWKKNNKKTVILCSNEKYRLIKKN